MKADLSRRRQQILSEIRSLAAERYQQKGFLDLDDVQELKQRALTTHGVERADAADLNFVREYYKDVLSHDAVRYLDGFLDSWMADQIRRNIERDKDKWREKKAQKQIDERELHYEHLDDHREELHLEDHVAMFQDFDTRRVDLDERLRTMNVDDKKRVLISLFFGHQREG